MILRASHKQRPGHVTADAMEMIRRAIATPSGAFVYVAATRKRLREEFWPILLRLNAEHGLNGVARETELRLRLPNGSQIILATADDLSSHRLVGVEIDTAIVSTADERPNE